MRQFQINRTDPSSTRVVEMADTPLDDGDARVRVDRFGLSANNVTYVVLGDRLGYWQFFPAADDSAGAWGVMPVWGFGDVVESRSGALAEGERLFGYFPPATEVVMRPEGATDRPVIDAAPHRAELPRGYNLYQRVLQEPGYDPADDDLRMLLFPLHITSWALWETLQAQGWFGAEQIVVVSASSKTALGLAQALRGDETAPETVGITSARNRAFVEALDLYDAVVDYDDLEAAVARRPSVIVDMAGSGSVLGRLHLHLDDHMLRSLNVGLTHWEDAGGNADIIRDRSEMFFAPGVIQARMKEWGAAEFGRRSGSFLQQAMEAGRDWLTIERVDQLDTLGELYDAVRIGALAPDRGLVIAPSAAGS